MPEKLPSLWKAYWKILALDDSIFCAIRDSRSGFGFALKLFVLVSLVAGLGLLVGLRADLARPTLVEIVAGLAGQVGALNTRLSANLEGFLGGILTGLLSPRLEQLAAEIAQAAERLRVLQAPLGVQTSRALRELGPFLYTPFRILAEWVGGLLVAFVVATQLGGRGALRQHLSLALLVVAPQVLRLPSFLFERAGIDEPFFLSLGFLLSMLALIWSMVIGVKALSVAHQVSTDRAIVIVLVTLLALYVIIPLLSVLLLVAGTALIVWFLSLII